MLEDGHFYLAFVVGVAEPAPLEVGGYLGIVNLAADSDGTHYSGAHLASVRHRRSRLRSRLQRKGTASARQLLRKTGRREHRFARDTSHRIAKDLVARAQGTNRGIALEDLSGIRSRIAVNRRPRRQQHSWAFSQLRQFITYKAAIAGVPVVAVDPRGTSRTCRRCGHRDKANRRARNEFSCQRCGFSAPADWNAAVNIGRAAVSRPYADGEAALAANLSREPVAPAPGS